MEQRNNDDVMAPVNAIAMLKADHQKVRNLFQQYQAASDPHTKRHLAEQVCIELETHAQLEEMIFYPAVAEETDKEGQQLVEEARQEHQQVKDLIAELRNTNDGEFDTQFQELMTHVEHHVQEEECEMFPFAEAELEEDMEDMAEEMQAVKQQLLAS
jgi:hemerythrin superfamily protein